MSEFNPTTAALKLALKRMFSQSYFDICTIDKCLKLTGSIPSADIYKVMNTVHCVHYADMDAQFRQWLFEQSILMFQNNGFDFNKFEVLEKNNAQLYLQ
jgi:hypothetical protein